MVQDVGAVAEHLPPARPGAVPVGALDADIEAGAAPALAHEDEIALPIAIDIAHQGGMGEDARAVPGHLPPACPTAVTVRAFSSHVQSRPGLNPGCGIPYPVALKGNPHMPSTGAVTGRLAPPSAPGVLYDPDAVSESGSDGIIPADQRYGVVHATF